MLPKDARTQAALEQFLEEARRDMWPKMKTSAMALSIMDGQVDIKLAVEIGAALLLDKPLILAIQPGVTVAPRLRMLADEVIEADLRTPMGKAKITAALARALERIKQRDRAKNK